MKRRPIKPRCTHHPLREVHSRDVCASCYNGIRARCIAGKPTEEARQSREEYFVQIGMWGRKESTLDDLIRQHEERAGLVPARETVFAVTGPARSDVSRQTAA